MKRLFLILGCLILLGLIGCDNYDYEVPLTKECPGTTISHDGITECIPPQGEEIVAPIPCCSLLVGYQEECINSTITEYQTAHIGEIDEDCCIIMCGSRERGCRRSCSRDNTYYVGTSCNNECYNERLACDHYCHSDNAGNDFNLKLIENDCILKPHIDKWNESKCTKMGLVKKLDGNPIKSATTIGEEIDRKG